MNETLTAKGVLAAMLDDSQMYAAGYRDGFAAGGKVVLELWAEAIEKARAKQHCFVSERKPHGPGKTRT